MKTTLLIPLLALACATSLRAQTVAGTQLEIGPSGSNQISDAGGMNIGGAIGYGNSVVGVGFMIGSYNDAWASGTICVGQFNYLQAGNSAVFGYNNEICGGNSLVSGSFNDVAWTPDDGSANGSTILGSYNGVDITCDATLVSGLNNFVTGDYPNRIQATTTLGYGLVNRWTHSTVVGRYNDDNLSGLLFAIGNGVDATHRSNALEVYSDGKIKMPRQGDILMGEFGNGD